MNAYTYRMLLRQGYSRDDVLQQLYGFDNRPFLDELTRLGFVIPRCAQSNYAWTALSISTSFHRDYLPNFTSFIQQGDQSRDLPAYQNLIAHSPVRTELAQKGYRMVAFETGYWFNEVTDAEVYIVGNKNPLEKYRQTRDINDFELLFLRTTALRVFTEAKSAFFTTLTRNVRTPEERHHDLVQFALDQLELVPDLPGKKFVYAHIVAPHSPFVFSPTGEYQSTGAVNPGYPNAILYVNSRILTVLKTILAKSSVPPVIILQADHGLDLDHRMPILNAYYLPGGGDQLVYSNITPVNTFRVVFNRYFGGNFPLIEDKSYFSYDTAPYSFTLVPAACTGYGK